MKYINTRNISNHILVCMYAFHTHYDNIWHVSFIPIIANKGSFAFQRFRFGALPLYAKHRYIFLDSIVHTKPTRPKFNFYEEFAWLIQIIWNDSWLKSKWNWCNCVDKRFIFQMNINLDHFRQTSMHNFFEQWRKNHEYIGSVKPLYPAYFWTFSWLSGTSFGHTEPKNGPTEPNVS